MSNRGSKVKPYSLHVELRSDYLYIHVKGEADSLEISTQFWKEIRDVSREQNAQNLLVNEDFRNNIDQIDIYALNNRIGQMGFFNTRIAFVDEQKDQFEVNTFGETVAANRGVNFKVFATIAEAEKWLRS